jgi:hypothetical protein
MQHSQIFRALLAVALALTLTVGAGAVGTVAAQNETDDAPTIDVNTNPAEPEQETAAEQIDTNVALIEWRYEDGAFILTFRSEAPSRITLTEAVQFAEGTGSGRIYSNQLASGLTELTVPVPRRGGQAALTMTTPLSIQQNRYSYVSTGETQPEKPPLDYDRTRLMVILTAVGAAGFTFRSVKNRREDETKEVERHL